MFDHLSPLGKVLATLTTAVVMIGVVWALNWGIDRLPIKAVYGLTGLGFGLAVGWLLCERYGSPRLKHIGKIGRSGDVDL